MNYIPLTKDQQDTCLQHIEYSRGQLNSDTELLRKWLNEQCHLPPSRLKESDGFLRSFLLGTKGSLEISKRKIDNYYSFRGSGASIHGVYDPTSDNTVALKGEIQLGFLPQSLDDGTRILVFRPSSLLAVPRFLACFQTLLMALELELRRDDIWSMALVILFDFGTATVTEFVKVDPLCLRDLFFMLQEVLPFRVRRLIYINLHPTLAVVANFLVKPLLSKKLNDRLIISQSGLDKTTEEVPKEIAPKEMGGLGASLDEVTEDFFEVIKKKRDWFVNELGEKTIESKRPDTCQRSKHLDFGVDGSFKKLVLD